MQPWRIGIDLGATKIGFGLVNGNNQIVARHRLPTEAEKGPQAVLEHILEGITALKKHLPAGEKLSAVGICTPGPVDHEKGKLIDPPNLPTLHHLPLRDMLTAQLNLPVSVEHDAKASALGEFHFGAGQGEQSMVYIVVGTGVGAALIINGQLYRGMANFAGEVGHISLNFQADPCPSAIPGCAQEYMCGPALARRYNQLTGQTVSGEDVANFAAQGDSQALQIMTTAGTALGVTIATLAMILNINRFVIGGSVAKAGNLFLEPARQTVPRYTFASINQNLSIVPASLADDGPILGCVWGVG